MWPIVVRELPLDQSQDQCALVLEIAVHQALADLRLCGNVADRAGVETTGDEAALRSIEDTLSLRLRTGGGGVIGGGGGKGIKRHCSSWQASS